MSFFKKCLSPVNKLVALLFVLFMGIPAFAGEANLVVPKIEGENFNLLVIGIIVSVLGLIWGLIAYNQVKKIQTHNWVFRTSYCCLCCKYLTGFVQ